MHNNKRTHHFLFLSFLGKEGEGLLHEVASHYIIGMKDMNERAPGHTTVNGKKQKWIFFIQFRAN